MFLSDKKLFEYLNKLTAMLIEDGNLYGLLLTGIVKYHDFEWYFMLKLFVQEL